MVQCYHKECLFRGRAPVKLRFVFKLDEYLEHLEEHVDQVGEAMQKRFGAIIKNIFSTKEELDELAPSPFSINQDIGLDHPSKLKANAAWHKNMENFGIDRFPSKKDSDITYICHWKDVLMKNNLVDSSSLTFQEDDALIYSIMHYPNPVPDWSMWQTIFLYSLKLMSSISGAALNLYRGVTFNRITTKKEELPGLRSFARNINHAAPSINTTRRVYPSLKYENASYHPSEKLFHIKCLEESKESFGFVFGENENVVTLPVCLMIDEQEVNQGKCCQGISFD